MSNIYYWEKRTFSKLFGKINSQKESLKKCISFEEENGFYQRSLLNGVGFRDIMNVSPNTLAKN